MSKLVMVVDDDTEIRETLRELLEDEGYQVVCAANGREALDYLRRSVRPCLILLDMMMPVMNGWEFREEQERDGDLRRIPVVIITAAGARQIASVASERILHKPLRMEKVLGVIEEYC